MRLLFASSVRNSLVVLVIFSINSISGCGRRSDMNTRLGNMQGIRTEIGGTKLECGPEFGGMAGYFLKSPHNVSEIITPKTNDRGTEWSIGINYGTITIMDILASGHDDKPHELRYYVYRMEVGPDGKLRSREFPRYIYTITLEGDFEQRLNVDEHVTEYYRDGKWVRAEQGKP